MPTYVGITSSELILGKHVSDASVSSAPFNDHNQGGGG